MAHVALTIEQDELVAAVARLVAARAGDDAAVASGLTSMGLVGLRAPEEIGGGATGAVEPALVVEQLARGLTGRGYLGAVLAVELLVPAGEGGARGGEAPDVRGRDLPGRDLPGPAAASAMAAEICAGRPAGVALDPGLSHLTRVDTDGAVALDPVGGAVVLGLDADDGVVAGAAGERLDGADLTRALHRVVAPVRPGGGAAPERLRVVEDATTARWLALALALVCADMVGAMAGALDGAVAHARDREQFGRPVGSFQAVQHLCADQLVSIEAARSVTWHAAWAVDALDPGEALHAARVAKAWCSGVGREVCETAIQVWGGLGMTQECDAHRFLRRVLLDRCLFGDERDHLTAIAASRIAPVPRTNGRDA